MISKLNISEINLLAEDIRHYFDQERRQEIKSWMYKTWSASIDGDILFKGVDLNMAKGDKIVLFSKIHVLPLLLRNLKRKQKQIK
jgi:hypothetical protein